MTADAVARTEQILAEMTMPPGVHAEVLSSSLASTGGHAAHLVVWGPATVTCPGCGQSERPVERPCPVTIDRGGFGGLQMWSHQHGCGQWWSPPWTSRDLRRWEPTEHGVREAIEELAQDVRERDQAALAAVSPIAADTKMSYIEVPESYVPQGARWTTPRSNQGQTVEVSYSTGDPEQHDESGPGDQFKRVIDHSDRSVSYYRLAEVPAAR